MGWHAGHSRERRPHQSAEWSPKSRHTLLLSGTPSCPRPLRLAGSQPVAPGPLHRYNRRSPPGLCHTASSGPQPPTLVRGAPPCTASEPVPVFPTLRKNKEDRQNTKQNTNGRISTRHHNHRKRGSRKQPMYRVQTKSCTKDTGKLGTLGRGALSRDSGECS